MAEKRAFANASEGPEQRKHSAGKLISLILIKNSFALLGKLDC